MKKSKLLLCIILVVLVVLGWGMGVYTFLNIKEVDAQNELVSEADTFVSKELYIRAIPVYKEALTHKTDSNTEIERKLLKCYYNFGDGQSYSDLAVDLEKRGLADEDLYVNLAEIYMESNDYANGVKYLEKGLTSYPDSDRLRKAYDSSAFLYEVNQTSYSSILPSSGVTASLYPAFDGTKWTYIGRYGWKEEIDEQFDKATPFSDNGFAAVETDGKYYIINNDGDRYSVSDSASHISDVLGVSDDFVLVKTDKDYAYYWLDDWKSTGEQFMFDMVTAYNGGFAAVKKGKWGINKNTGEQVLDYTLNDIPVNSLGAAFAGDGAMAQFDDGLYYLINTTGTRISDKGYRGAKAPEEESGMIAVQDESGKWGFMDWNGDLRIPCQYDDAYSFSDGLAAVCEAGSWNYIASDGVKVIDDDFHNGAPFHMGIAPVVLQDDTAALVSLNYCSERDG